MNKSEVELTETYISQLCKIAFYLAKIFQVNYSATFVKTMWAFGPFPTVFDILFLMVVLRGSILKKIDRISFMS